MSRRRSIALSVATVALLVPASGVERAAGGQPQARASKACGAVEARNGGRARSIAATGGTSCRAARKVAARATGRRFRAFDYRCFPTKVSGEYNRLYGCSKAGTGRGIGFFYKRP